MTLKLRLTLTTTIAMMIVALIAVVGGLRSQQQAERRFEQATIQGKAVLWKKIIAAQIAEMATGTVGLTRDRESLDALRENNREALHAAMNTTYNRLSASKIISQLQVINTTGEIVFSAPNATSGKTMKQLALRALSESKIAEGLERDENGALNVEFVFPLFSRGSLIGAVIFARDLTGALSDFQENDQSYGVILNQSAEFELAVDEEKFDDLGLTVESIDQPIYQRVNKGESAFAVIGTPIFDTNKVPIAMLVSAKDFSESYHAQDESNMLSALAILLGLSSVCGGMYWFVNRSFAPMNALVAGMQDIAEGNLTRTFPIASRDEIGLLQEAMNKMTTTLREIITNIGNSSVKLSSAAEKLARITIETNEGTKKQQSEAEQVATSANELAATVQEVSRSTQLAADASHKASESARAGREVVNKTIDAINDLAQEVQGAATVMDKLKESTQSIGVVIDVIRSIADQTNLLALNAAIEAARAGEQGRGFAVVADEVRTLASRTQQSTQEINTMIQRLQEGSHAAVKAMQESQTCATAGVNQAARMGDALEEITHSVETINSMAAQIASASEEQSAAAEEIDRNVSNISNVVEQNALSTEQIYIASEELAGLAANLQAAVQRFKT